MGDNSAKKIIKLITNFEEYFVMFVIALMAVIVAIQVFSRYFLRAPLIWSEEMVRYLFTWITFIGAGYAFKNNLHIRIDLFFNKLTRSVKKIVTVLNNLLAIGCFIYVMPSAISFMLMQNEIESPAMQIPMSMVAASVPLGLGILVIRIAIDTIGVLMNKAENSIGGEEK